MASTIITKNKNTGAPASLHQGELAINTTNGSIYYGSTGGTSVSSSFTLGHTTASVISSSGLITGKVLAILDEGNEGDDELVTLQSAINTYTISGEGVFSGTAALASNVTVAANNTADETVYLTHVDGATGTQGIETDTGLTYNPSSGFITASGGLVCAQVSASGKIQTAGAISSSTGITASDAFFSNDITASGAISSSGVITADQYKIANGITLANFANPNITLGQTNKNAILRGDTIQLGAATDQHITASGAISASGKITAPIFAGQVETVVNHSFYCSGWSAIDDLACGKNNYGWSDRAWSKFFSKSDIEGTGFDGGENAHHGVLITHDLDNLTVISSLRPQGAVTALAIYLYSGSAQAGAAQASSHLGFICSASSPTLNHLCFNDIYITGSEGDGQTGFSIKAGERLYVMIQSSLTSTFVKGTYKIMGERI